MSERPDPLVTLGTTQPIHDLRPDQCMVAMVNDVVTCLRELGPDHPQHDTSLPIGATRRNIETYLDNERARRRRP